MNADGSEHLPLTTLGPGRMPNLAWSPDGRKLAFLYSSCGQFCSNLYVVNSNGSGLRNLTSKLGAGGYGPGAGLASDPVWSPDGRKIAFVRVSKRLGVYVVNADGSGGGTSRRSRWGPTPLPPGRPTGARSPSPAPATTTPRSTS